MEESEYYGKYAVTANEDAETVVKVIGKVVVIDSKNISVDGILLKWKEKEIRKVGSHAFLTGETDKGFVIIQKTRNVVLLAVTLGPTIVIDATTTKWTGEILTLTPIKESR